MNKLTKIIATIGPSSDSLETIEELIRLGVNVFRFNFKHSDIEWHKERIKRVLEVSKKINLPIATLLDLQGPEIRLAIPFDKMEISENEKILLSPDVLETKEKGITLSDPEIINLLKTGQRVLADDGNFEFEVLKENENTFLLSKTTGILGNRKTVNIVDLDFDFPVIHDRDRQGLMLAKEFNLDFIALSFVRNENDLIILKEEMDKLELKSKIVAKIETPKAIENIDKILQETDAIMIARGDLGVEMPLEEVPFYQKEIIKKCIELGIPVITATQMLESMISKKIPTRAEVSDVANAIYDYTDAIMLSGETANGSFPKEAVKVMAKVASFSENKDRHLDIRNLYNYDLGDLSKMVCDSAFNLYKSLKTKNQKPKGFIVFTHTGKTAKMLSRYRPHVNIFAFCPTSNVAQNLALSFGVTPILQDSVKKDEILKEDISKAMDFLKEKNMAEKGDLFIVLHGDYWTSDAGTSTIRIVSLT